LENTLDESKTAFDFSAGNQASGFMQTFGYLIVISALSAIGRSWIVTLVVLSIGLRMATTRNGIKLDAIQGKYKVYTAYLFFIKIGKWQSLDNYPHLSVLGTQAGEKTTSWGGNENTLTERVWDLMLLTPNHRGKLFVKRFQDEAAAWDQADILARALKKECTTYNPQISAASRAMRERGIRR